MKTGEEIVLAAIKKEFRLLSKKADKAKKECDEYFSVGTEMLAIHKEFAEIIKSKKHGDEVLKKLDLLKKRSDKTEQIRKKDYLKLSDREFNSKMEADKLMTEIQRIEFRMQIRKQG